MCAHGAGPFSVNFGLYEMPKLAAMLEEISLGAKLPPEKTAEESLREALRKSVQGHATRMASVLGIYPA